MTTVHTVPYTKAQGGIGRRPKMYANSQKFVTETRVVEVNGVHRPFQFVTNSVLSDREWERLDQTVYQMQRLRLNAVDDLRSRGLVHTLQSFGIMSDNWRVSTEKKRATAQMDPRTAVDRDRAEKHEYGTPVPIIYSDYEIGWRELEASRLYGSPLDTTEAAETTQAVVEQAEYTLFNGDSTVVVNGQSISGYRTITGRTTDTATNFGGGDFGTITNIYTTFQNAISTMAGKRFYGPFMAYVSNTQYHQMNAIYTDGSGQSAKARVLGNIADIADIKDVQTDFLADGEILLVQMTSDVVELTTVTDFDEPQNREMNHPLDDTLVARIMMVAVPRIKTNSAGNVGICHITGA